MKTHKTLLGLILTGLLTIAGWTQMQETTRYSFTAESKMYVEGTSSLHGWKAEVKSLSGTMDVTGGLLHGGTLTKGTLTIPVSALDCDNATMNKKMFEALKADAHKTITYELTSAELAAPPSGNTFQIRAKGNLTLAGVQKPVEITLKGQDLGGGKLRLTGSYPLVMTDYGIRPPTAMLGTLKTGDKVTVHFDLVTTEEAAL